MGRAVAIGVRSMFCLLGCVMLATLIYTISIDGLPFRKDLLTPWMAVTLIDFYIIVLAIAAWIFYKESNIISAIVWTVLLVCFGSLTTCIYIVWQLFKLSPQESLQDPIYFVLLQHKTKDEVEEKGMVSVITTRVVFSALGCLMLGTLLYTLITDGSPFRRELYTPWIVATLIDLYINIATLSVWVLYKESSWISSFFWIVLFICFGSVSICAYIVVQLFHLSSQDPASLVLFSSSNRLQ